MDVLSFLFTVRGRASRMEYWIFQILVLPIIFLFVILAIGAITAVGNNGAALFAVMILYLLALIATVWIMYACMGRRWHDRGKSAWMSVLFLVVPGLVILSGIFGGTAGLTAALQSSILNLVHGGVGLWFFIELGFLGPVNENNPYDRASGVPGLRTRAADVEDDGIGAFGSAQAAIDAAIRRQQESATRSANAAAVSAGRRNPGVAMARSGGPAPVGFGRRNR